MKENDIITSEEEFKNIFGTTELDLDFGTLIFFVFYHYHKENNIDQNKNIVDKIKNNITNIVSKKLFNDNYRNKSIDIVYDNFKIKDNNNEVKPEDLEKVEISFFDYIMEDYSNCIFNNKYYKYLKNSSSLIVPQVTNDTKSTLNKFIEGFQHNNSPPNLSANLLIYNDNALKEEGGGIDTALSLNKNNGFSTFNSFFSANIIDKFQEEDKLIETLKSNSPLEIKVSTKEEIFNILFMINLYKWKHSKKNKDLVYSDIENYFNKFKLASTSDSKCFNDLVDFIKLNSTNTIEINNINYKMIRAFKDNLINDKPISIINNLFADSSINPNNLFTNFKALKPTDDKEKVIIDRIYNILNKIKFIQFYDDITVYYNKEYLEDIKNYFEKYKNIIKDDEIISTLDIIIDKNGEIIDYLKNSNFTSDTSIECSIYDSPTESIDTLGHEVYVTQVPQNPQRNYIYQFKNEDKSNITILPKCVTKEKLSGLSGGSGNIDTLYGELKTNIDKYNKIIATNCETIFMLHFLNNDIINFDNVNMSTDNEKKFPGQFIFFKNMKCINTNVYNDGKTDGDIRINDISYDKIKHFEDNDLPNEIPESDVRRKNVVDNLYSYFGNKEDRSNFIFNQALSSGNTLRNLANGDRGILTNINMYNTVIQEKIYDPEIKKQMFNNLVKLYSNQIGNLCDLINNMLIEEAFLVDKQTLEDMEIDIEPENNNNNI